MLWFSLYHLCLCKCVLSFGHRLIHFLQFAAMPGNYIFLGIFIVSPKREWTLLKVAWRISQGSLHPTHSVFLVPTCCPGQPRQLPVTKTNTGFQLSVVWPRASAKPVRIRHQGTTWLKILAGGLFSWKYWSLATKFPCHYIRWDTFGREARSPTKSRPKSSRRGLLISCMTAAQMGITVRRS